MEMIGIRFGAKGNPQLGGVVRCNTQIWKGLRHSGVIPYIIRRENGDMEDSRGIIGTEKEKQCNILPETNTLDRRYIAITLVPDTLLGRKDLRKLKEVLTTIDNTSRENPV